MTLLDPTPRVTLPDDLLDAHVTAAAGILDHLAAMGCDDPLGREAAQLRREAFPVGLGAHLLAPLHLRVRLDRRLALLLLDPAHAALAVSFGLDTLAHRLQRLDRERARAHALEAPPAPKATWRPGPVPGGAVPR